MEQITLKNSVLVVKKKQHDFVAGNVPNNEIIPKKKSQRYTEDCLFEFWRSLATARDAHWHKVGLTLDVRYSHI